jgi:hypothetical protein
MQLIFIKSNIEPDGEVQTSIKEMVAAFNLYWK